MTGGRVWPRKQTRAGGSMKRFSRTVVTAVDDSKILGIRAGQKSEHKFTGVWPVVVNGRILVRSWTLKPEGWYRTFLGDPLGVIQVGERQLRVRAVPIRSDRVRDAVERADAEKYATKAAGKYVRGFRTPRRRAATIELRPR